MKRKLAAVALCVVVFGVAGGQPPPIDANPPVTTAVPSLTLPGGQAANAPTIPNITVTVDQTSSLPRIENTAQPAAPVPQTFDALVNELQSVRTQKADLEKREKAITEALLKKFAEQKNQLEKLGVVTVPPPPTASKLEEDIPTPVRAPRDKTKDENR